MSHCAGWSNRLELTEARGGEIRCGDVELSNLREGQRAVAAVGRWGARRSLGDLKQQLLEETD